VVLNDERGERASQARGGFAERASVLIVASVGHELSPIISQLGAPRSVALGRRPGAEGELCGREVCLLECGIGKAAAAASLAAALETRSPSSVLAIGIGGAYPGAGLLPRDLALASEEIFADEGVETPAGWQGYEAFVVSSGAQNRIALDGELVARARAALDRVALGPFATVSTCSGTELLARRMEKRWGAIMESMEGAAWALVARRYGVPFVELRAVSNVAEDRDVKAWDLGGAVAALAAALPSVLPVLP
jgi:futalosine hydrolase